MRESPSSLTFYPSLNQRRCICLPLPVFSLLDLSISPPSLSKFINSITSRGTIHLSSYSMVSSITFIFHQYFHHILLIFILYVLILINISSKYHQNRIVNIAIIIPIFYSSITTIIISFILISLLHFINTLSCQSSDILIYIPNPEVLNIHFDTKSSSIQSIIYYIRVNSITFTILFNICSHPLYYMSCLYPFSWLNSHSLNFYIELSQH
jgi:hypothetical protein